MRNKSKNVNTQKKTKEAASEEKDKLGKGQISCKTETISK